ncbi:Type 1 phosphatases regulator ypi1 [Coemansia sp. Benny D115]|nr:Type 1 phosphatases regulator ypi1 [Coemansia sp. Benny D115]
MSSASDNTGGGGAQHALSTHGSRTLVTSSTEARRPTGILHLRGSAPPSEAQESTSHVQWAADTVDNEGLGRKKSKICCIFRKQRAFGESDSDSSDSSGSDSDGPNEYERMPKYKKHPHHKCHKATHANPASNSKE